MLYMFHDAERNYNDFWGDYDCINEDYAIKLGQDLANQIGSDVRITNGHNGKTVAIVHPIV